MSESQAGVCGSGVAFVHRTDPAGAFEAYARVVPALGETSREHVRLLSAHGKGLELSRGAAPTHVFSAFDGSVGTAVVCVRSVPIPSGVPLFALFASMLCSMGVGARVLVESARGRGAQWIDAEDMVRAFRTMSVGQAREIGNGWLRLHAGAGLEEELRSCGSLVPILAHRAQEALRVIEAAGEAGRSAEDAYVYSLRWALHSRSMLDRLWADLGWREARAGVDMGGGLGFLTCELGRAGHAVTNVEIDSRWLETTQPWLAQVSGVSDRVTSVCSAMEHATREVEGRDFCLFMGSLLCVNRQHVGAMLKDVYARLAPGGVMVLRENLAEHAEQEADAKGQMRFTGGELSGLLDAVGGRTRFFDHTGVELSETGGSRAVFAAMYKPQRERLSVMLEPKPKSANLRQSRGVGHGVIAFSIVQPTEEQIGQAEQVLAACGCEFDGVVIASAGSDVLSLQPSGVESRPRVSVAMPLETESLGCAVLMPPLRWGCDAFGEAIIAQYYNAVKRGGVLAAGFAAERGERVERGVWTLDWLRDLLGREERVIGERGVAMFRRGEPLLARASMWTTFVREVVPNLDALLGECQQACGESFEPCGLVRARGDGLVESVWTKVLPQAFSSAEELRKFATYSVTGAGYKAGALRYFVDEFLPRRHDVRVVDIGGGIGLVDLELLISMPRVASVVNLDPVAAGLPLTSRVIGKHPELRGRYSVALMPAEAWGFEEAVDVVADFAALLHMPRERLQPTLDRAWASLRDGGMFVVHENIRRARFLERGHYDEVFTVEEIDGLLGRYGAIERFRSTDLTALSAEQAGESTVFRVVRKSGA